MSQISAASYGLTIEAGEALKVLGNNGVRFQNRVRQLKNRVAGGAAGAADNGRVYGRPNSSTQFLFDLAGTFGQLYDENSGRILGGD